MEVAIFGKRRGGRVKLRRPQTYHTKRPTSTTALPFSTESLRPYQIWNFQNKYWSEVASEVTLPSITVKQNTPQKVALVEANVKVTTRQAVAKKKHSDAVDGQGSLAMLERFWYTQDMYVSLAYLRFLLFSYLPPWTINISALTPEYAKAAGILVEKEGVVTGNLRQAPGVNLRFWSARISMWGHERWGIASSSHPSGTSLGRSTWTTGTLSHIVETWIPAPFEGSPLMDQDDDDHWRGRR